MLGYVTKGLKSESACMIKILPYLRCSMSIKMETASTPTPLWIVQICTVPVMVEVYGKWCRALNLSVNGKQWHGKDHTRCALF